MRCVTEGRRRRHTGRRGDRLGVIGCRDSRGALHLPRSGAVIHGAWRLLAIAPTEPALEITHRTRVAELALRGGQPDPARLAAAIVAH